jgi:chemotaxis protein CheX
MDAKLINPFIKATVNVLKTMALVKSTAGKPYLKNNNIANGDVTGVIGVTGAANGSISVTFVEGSILQIVSNMFGEEMQELNSEVSDAVGEIANMISGQARMELEASGTVFEGSIPSVVTGKNHEISHITDGPKIAIPFTTEAGEFTVELCFEN